MKSVISQRNLQFRHSLRLTATSEFVGYIDAFGYVDDTRCLRIGRTAARYLDHPEGLLPLDAQLVFSTPGRCV